MEKKLSANALNAAEIIYEFAKDSLLISKNFNGIQPDLNYFAQFCKLDEIPAILFAVGLITDYEEFSMQTVFEHLGFRHHEILRYNKHILQLTESGLIKPGRRGIRGRGTCEIPNDVIYHFSENIPFEKKEIKIKGLTDFLEKFNKLVESLDDEIMCQMEFRDELNYIIKENENIPLIKKASKDNFNHLEWFLFLTTVHDAVKEGDNDYNTNIQMTLESYSGNRTVGFSTISQVTNGQIRPVQKGYMELSRHHFRNRINARLTNKILRELKEDEGIIIDLAPENDNRELILHEKIKSRELFFNPNEKEQLDTVQNLLNDTSFLQLQKKLEEKAMPLGLTLLFYGFPGTGKTESVYQLAKATGRNIFKVDIADTKSMWYGESQKLTRQIFRDYEKLKKDQERCPILLFNEADAVIGKRKTSGSTNVSDTENSIQNILLEQLENFEGILIATTNLHTNLDDAFERRFLYKIRFEKPEAEISSKIWKSMLPFVTEEESRELAEEFDFSGGEIQNIARKSLMVELIHNQKPNFNSVMKLCRHERWDSDNGKREKMGFKK